MRRGWDIAADAFRRAQVSPTFHGRDVFAPTAARLAVGASPEDAGPEVDLEGSLGPRPLLYSHGGRHVTGHVVHVDRFGNLVTDIPAVALPDGPTLAVRVGTHEIEGVRRTYEDVAAGEALAYVGSACTLEIAVRGGSATDKLKVARGAAVVVVA
jgi:S-adenosylmethionine hydrolase